MNIFRHVDVQPLMSFQLHGTLDTLIVVDSAEDLRIVVKDYPGFYFLGKGSNTVVAPDQEGQCIVKFSKQFSQVLEDNGRFTVQAGMTVPQLLRACEERSFTGLEFIAGVPASVGGMVAMNFGCWGQSIGEVIESVQVMDLNGDVTWLPQSKCGFGYRNSLIKEEGWIVLAVSFQLKNTAQTDIRSSIKKNIRRRLDSQPLRGKTFGSVFKNPVGDYAARLIDSCGLKGFEHNGVKVSGQHANFFENLGAGTFHDLLHLIQHVSSTVWDRYHVKLEPEVCLVSGNKVLKG